MQTSTKILTSLALIAAALVGLAPRASSLASPQNAMFYGGNANSTPLLLVSDNFTRANAASLGANWSNGLGASLSIAILSNQAATPASGPGIEYWSANAFTSNQFSKMTLSNMVAAFNDEAYARGSNSAATAYFCGLRQSVDASDYVVRKLVANTQTVLYDGLPAVTVGDVIELDAVGTTITCKVNGSVIFSGTDSSISGGSPGIYVNNGASLAVISHWSGGNL